MLAAIVGGWVSELRHFDAEQGFVESEIYEDGYMHPPMEFRVMFDNGTTTNIVRHEGCWFCAVLC